MSGLEMEVKEGLVMMIADDGSVVRGVRVRVRWGWTFSMGEWGIGIRI